MASEPPSPFEEFLETLVGLDEALDHNVELTYHVKQRIHEIRKAYDEGKLLKSVIHETRPLIVDCLRQAHEALGRMNSTVRSAEIWAMRMEGMDTPTLAQFLGEEERTVELSHKEHENDYSEPEEDH